MAGLLDKQNERYSDFTTNLDKHPLTGELLRTTNADSVKKSIRNLLLTNHYDRPGRDPQLGGNITALLFENATAVTTIALKEAITDTINNYEPRAVLHRVNVTSREDENAYVVSVVFSLINTSEEITYDLTLNRIR